MAGVPPPLLAKLAFTGTWRDYQQRVLDEFDAHTRDSRLHLVAAPGSGKTIVGIELLRRLGRPALVLAPTRTVRDQWLARLTPLFLSDPPGPGEVSKSLDTPAQLTATTYQALHARARDGDLADLVAALGANGEITLVLDEAHHLRREWWQALGQLAAMLPAAQIVALTATPPYDAPASEWARYEAMCGPIDLEVSVPELVRNGDLCPHQDHILFSAPDQQALDLLDRRRLGVAAFLTTLRSDTELLAMLESHPWLQDPKSSVEPILEAPEVLSAILILLASAGRRLPPGPLELLGVRASDVPQASAYWLEVLLDALLFGLRETFPIGDHRKREWSATLHEYGLIEGGKVRLGESRATFQAMAGSVAKIASIVEIARVESETLGTGLRMVVLAEHVRAGELPRSANAEYLPARLGVVPIFEALRRAEIGEQRLAVLTGSLVILPVALNDALQAMAERLGLNPADLEISQLNHPSQYCVLKASGQASGRLVELLTALFCSGQITILVGTQALLGEGWDAPPVNSLVLASNSAAFMLSNQMRGRAIRIDPTNPAKVSNIWHLATSPELPGSPLVALAGQLEWGAIDPGDAIVSDIDLLANRFHTFEGIGNSDPCRIESGLDRLGLCQAQAMTDANARTLALARDRASIARRWSEALGDAQARTRLRETASPNYAPRGLAWFDTLRWLAASALSSGMFAAAQQLRDPANLSSLPTFAMAASGAATLAMLPRLARAAWLTLRNGSIEGSLKQSVRTVLEALEAVGQLPGDSAVNCNVRIDHGIGGDTTISLEGLSRANERTVLQALAELLGAVQNPRYLLVRRSRIWLHSRFDYHAVPTVLGARKEWAELFASLWQRRVGSSRLAYTRTPNGRLDLLRARSRSFAAGFQRRVNRRSAWM